MNWQAREREEKEVDVENQIVLFILAKKMSSVN